MKNVLLVIAVAIPLVAFCCEHNNKTRKCLPCLRTNYMKYGGERAATTCDESRCPVGRMQTHKHCGRHAGEVVTLSSECPKCAELEAKEHWREAEVEKSQDKAWKKLGIKMPEYRVTTAAQKTIMLKKLRTMINGLTKQIEKYEDRMFSATPGAPALSEAQLRRLEKRIEEVEMEREILTRAYTIWEEFTP